MAAGGVPGRPPVGAGPAAGVLPLGLTVAEATDQTPGVRRSATIATASAGRPMGVRRSATSRPMTSAAIAPPAMTTTAHRHQPYQDVSREISTNAHPAVIATPTGN